MTGRKRIDVINALFDRALIARVTAQGVDEALAAAGTQYDLGIISLDFFGQVQG